MLLPGKCLDEICSLLFLIFPGKVSRISGGQFLRRISRQGNEELATLFFLLCRGIIPFVKDERDFVRDSRFSHFSSIVRQFPVNHD